MATDELASAKQERDKLKERIRLLREGGMRTKAGVNLENDTTDVTLHQAEQQLQAVERRIDRLSGKG
jgi:hypothetical protein